MKKPTPEDMAAAQVRTEEVIEGLKLIKLTGRVSVPDDPSYPFKLEVVLRAPSFMEITFVGLYGGCEEVVVRAMTREAIDQFIELNDFRRHPRFSRMTITSTDGGKETTEVVDRRSASQSTST